MEEKLITWKYITKERSWLHGSTELMNEVNYMEV